MASEPLNDIYQDGQAFDGLPSLSQEGALGLVVDTFADSWSMSALMGGLTCTEANAMIELFRSLGQDHMAEVALTAHADDDDDPDDEHYVDDNRTGRYRSKEG